MSCYGLVVFSDTPDGFDELLAPFNKNNKDCYVFISLDEQQIKARYEDTAKEKMSYDEYLEARKLIRNDDGKLGVMANPQGYYSNYMLDGRDLYYLKPDELPDESDRYRKKQYDFSMPKYDPKESSDFWDDYVVAGVPPKNYALYERTHYMERYGTKEQFMKEKAFRGPSAFVTPDGTWHAPSDVAWLGIDNGTAESMNAYMQEWDAYIKANPNPYVSFVDCRV